MHSTGSENVTASSLAQGWLLPLSFEPGLGCDQLAAF